MKANSASVIVLAGAALITCGAFVGHVQSKLFVQAIGCLVGVVGLVGWFVAVTRSEAK